jgi:hypothetical protein
MVPPSLVVGNRRTVRSGSPWDGTASPEAVDDHLEELT